MTREEEEVVLEMSREIMDWPDWKLAYALDVYGFDLDEIPKIIKRIKDGESIQDILKEGR